MGEVKEEKEEDYTRKESDRVVGYDTITLEYDRRARYNERLEKLRRYDRG